MSRWRLAVTVALGALVAVGCSSTISTVEPPAELGRIESQVEITKAWSTSVAGEEEDDLLLALAPSSDGRRVYIAGRDGEVEALDLATGDRAWRVTLPRRAVSSTKALGLWSRLWGKGEGSAQRIAAGPTIGGGLVITGSSDGEVAALSADDGTLLWTIVLGSEVAAAPATDGRVAVIRLGSGQLVALDARTGAQRWIADQPVPALSIRGAGRPLIEGNRVYAGFDSGKVIAFDLDNGQIVWEAPLAMASGRSEVERLVDADGAIQLAASELFAVAFHGRAASIDIDSGRPLWQRDFSSAKGLSVDGAAVYLTDSDSQVWALDRANGGPLWTQADLRARALTAPVVAGRLVLVGDLDGYIHALDAATGRIVGRRNVGGAAIVAPPLLVGELVIVQTAAGRVVALRIAVPADAPVDAPGEPRG